MLWHAVQGHGISGKTAVIGPTREERRD